jgi:hypothetical protein
MNFGDSLVTSELENGVAVSPFLRQLGLALSQQVAAVYELQHFKDYSYASVPILEDLRARLPHLPADTGSRNGLSAR